MMLNYFFVCKSVQFRKLKKKFDVKATHFFAYYCMTVFAFCKESTIGQS